MLGGLQSQWYRRGSEAVARDKGCAHVSSIGQATTNWLVSIRGNMTPGPDLGCAEPKAASDERKRETQCVCLVRLALRPSLHDNLAEWPSAINIPSSRLCEPDKFFQA
ncbi:hypothetical protein CHS0354_001612, partial [Potamilus streckersoni]